MQFRIILTALVALASADTLVNIYTDTACQNFVQTISCQNDAYNHVAGTSQWGNSYSFSLPSGSVCNPPRGEYLLAHLSFEGAGDGERGVGCAPQVGCQQTVGGPIDAVVCSLEANGILKRTHAKQLKA